MLHFEVESGSQIYQNIQDNHKYDEPTRKNKMELPDFISSWVYSNGLNARCVLKPDSPFKVDNASKRSLCLDLRGLYREFPIEEAILKSNITDLSRIRDHVEPIVNQAWQILEESTATVDNAFKFHADALRIYLEELLGLKISDILSDIKVSATGPEVSLSIPEKAYFRYKLRGVDKFIFMK